MKIGPMAVWAAEIIKMETPNNIAEFQKVIDADSKIIHSEALTGVCIFVYSATLAFLINNRHDKDRAGKAFEFGLKIAQMD